MGGPPVISHFSGLFNGNFQDREFILLQAVIFVGTLGGNFGGFILLHSIIFWNAPLIFVSNFGATKFKK